MTKYKKIKIDVLSLLGNNMYKINPIISTFNEAS